MDAKDLIREALQETVKPYLNSPLLLSGGIDSASILAAQISLGGKPTCYTFQFGEFPSQDVKVSKQMCETFGIDHKIVIVPRDEESIVADIRRILPIIKSDKKVNVQCSIPMLYLGKAMKDDGFNDALTGLDADILLGTGRSFTEASYYLTNAQWRQTREETLKFAHIESSDVSDIAIDRTLKHEGINMVSIYALDPIKNCLLDRTYRELYQPRPKWIMLKAFPEFWSKGKWYRKNASYQVVSGIRDAHDLLLQNPTLNRKNHKQVVGIYRDIAKGFV